MTDLYDDIYQETILDHNKSPRNFKVMENADHKAEGYNPLCGDQVTVYLRVNDGKIEEISFKGQGCAICVASASIMTQNIEGRSLAEAEGLVSLFQRFLTEHDCPLVHDSPHIGKLEVFGGVREFPMRVKCATLPWHTCRAAIHDSNDAISTE